jgi:hypothetical protein
MSTTASIVNHQAWCTLHITHCTLHTGEGDPAFDSPATALYKAALISPGFVCWLLLLACLSMCGTKIPAENWTLNSTTSGLIYNGFSKNVMSSAPCTMFCM